MPKQTLDVPKKPTDMAAFWPADGRKEVKKTDGIYIQYRDIQIGPFPGRTEASWYDGQVQDVIMGWIDKSRFAGRIFPFGDAWYIERWETNDGPFPSLSLAWEHRQRLYSDYRQAIERHWDASGGYPADVERQKKWTKVPAEATDDIMDVSYEASIRQFVEENADKVAAIMAESDEEVENVTDDIVVPGGWVVPSAEVLAEWEQNKKDLEGTYSEDEDEDIVPDDKPLTHGDIPVIMGILMDRLGITRFEFSYDEMMAFKGRVLLDQPDSHTSSYVMVRQGK
jgi:hypothetical protein